VKSSPRVWGAAEWETKKKVRPARLPLGEEQVFMYQRQKNDNRSEGKRNLNWSEALVREHRGEWRRMGKCSDDTSWVGLKTGYPELRGLRSGGISKLHREPKRELKKLGELSRKALSTTTRGINWTYGADEG